MCIFWTYKQIFDTKDEAYKWWRDTIVENGRSPYVGPFADWLDESLYTKENIFFMSDNERAAIRNDYYTELEEIFQHMIEDGDITVR